MALPWDSRAAAADQKVEIRTPVRLQDVLNVKLLIAPEGFVSDRREPSAPFGEHLFRNVEVQAARADVELDHVALLDERERPAGRRLRGDMQHDRAERRSRHSRV